jgi:hypothetical protein
MVTRAPLPLRHCQVNIDEFLSFLRVQRHEAIARLGLKFNRTPVEVKTTKKVRVEQLGVAQTGSEQPGAPGSSLL